MAHRDIPVVFHHINFTPVPPVFLFFFFAEMWQDGDREENEGSGEKKKMDEGDREEEEKQRAGMYMKPAALIWRPVPAASERCQSCLVNKQTRISPKLISSLTVLLSNLSIYWCNTEVLLAIQFKEGFVSLTLLIILLQLATRTVTVSHGFVPVGFFLQVALLGLLLLHFTCHAAEEKYSAKKNFH